MSTADRRTLIVDGATDLIATRGLRALTHRALDTALELPAGSTSYYFRTKRALVEAIVDRITTRSRTDFLAADLPAAEPGEIAHAIAVWLDRLLAQRRNQLIARHALIIDLLGDADMHVRLTASLFSHDHATRLFAGLGSVEPATAAADFIAVLEGLVFDRFAGMRSTITTGDSARIAELTRVIEAQLACA
ncbi:TetR family transcriptional regulator [Nocardia sp. NEAU-G5]|uniref:TetR family transcriptional regulator n=1 Tax=Nocardia albiluteola TaxID=2842303 RepID=A0ABS6AUF6_9NOCA|nr:TetR family transcriptional regulator [Nocardia albiluteola]MBU3060674.1 TetR family transcriptional regulator [Nocardia albiluteola]